MICPKKILFRHASVLVILFVGMLSPLMVQTGTYGNFRYTDIGTSIRILLHGFLLRADADNGSLTVRKT